MKKVTKSEFKGMVDGMFLRLQRNCAGEDETRRYMGGREYLDEVDTRYGGMGAGDDARAVANSCAYCLYMMFE